MNTPGIIILAVVLMAGLLMSVSSKRGWVRLTGLAMVATALAAAGFFVWQSHHWNRGFDCVHAGDRREFVRHIMGAPTEDTNATIGIYGSKRLVTDQIKGCTEQYWYYPFFTPECWWVAFDAQGRVLTYCHYVSP